MLGFKTCRLELPAAFWNPIVARMAARRDRPMHSWEQRAPHTWEDPRRQDQDEGSGDESDPENNLDAEGVEAGQYFISMLLHLHYTGKMSAKTVCCLCWWAKQAGIQGPAKDYAYKPTAQSGKFQRHIDRVNGIDLKDVAANRYTVATPGHSKHDCARTVHDLPVVNPHEALHEEVVANPSILVDLQRARDEGLFPPAYWENPVVRNSEQAVLPLALYLDGVPTTTRDGVLGIFVYNLITYKRHLVAVLRKSNFCKCGCRGGVPCSLFSTGSTGPS